MSELESFFAHYAERYMASDVDAISAVYEAPLLAVREGRAIHLADRAEVDDHLSELMTAYKNAGAARADITEHSVRIRLRQRDGKMRPLRYSINVTLDGRCDHRAFSPDEERAAFFRETLQTIDTA